MRRFLSLSVVLFICTWLCTFPVCAESEINIVYPQDGSEVTELDELRVVAGTGVLETIFELDGQIIGTVNSNGDLSLPTEDIEIFPGKHKLNVYGVLSDGSLSESGSDFLYVNSFVKDIAQTDFESEVEYSADSKVITKLPPEMIYMPKVNGDIKSEIKLAEGKNGGSALKIELNASSNNGWGGPYIEIKADADSETGSYPGNLNILEFDMKLATICDFFAVDFQSDPSDKKSYFGANNQKGIFVDNGKIFGTNKEYLPDVWMSVKFVMDYNTGESAVYIDGELIKVYENAVPKGYNLYFARLRLTSGRANATDASVTLDNIKLYSKYKYSGIEKVTAVLDEVESEGVIPVNTEALKVYMNQPLKADNVNADTVRLLADGSEVQAASLAYSDEDKAIVYSLSDTLPADSALEIILSENLRFFDGKKVGMGARHSLRTENVGFSVEKVSYKSMDNIVLSKKQLKTGNELSCLFDFSNATNKDVQVLLVMTIMDRNRIIKVIPIETTVVCGRSTQAVTATIPEAEELRVTSIACDSFTRLKPLSGIASLK